MTPYYINYLGGDYINGTQCMDAGSNSYQAMHGAYADGNYNNWTAADTVFSMAYWTRKDIQTHYDIADGFTLLDMNHQSVMTATDPNRCMWMSGSINVPGSPSNLHGDGGAMLDNVASPGESPLHPWILEMGVLERVDIQMG
jgi:phospholipase C